MKKEYYLRHTYEVVSSNNSHMFAIWKEHIVFSWRWWFGLALTIVPWIIWLKIKDNKKVARLLFVALVVGLVTDLLDILGLCLGLWYYEWKVVPITPIYIPWNFTLFPVTIMLMLQFKPKVNRFIKAFAFAAFASYISEPFFAWLGIYIMLHWKHWYSFIIYIPLYLFFDKIYNSKLLSKCEND